VTRRSDPLRAFYRALSLAGSVKAARRGPGALGRRYVRMQANRVGNKALRRIVKP